LACLRHRRRHFCFQPPKGTVRNSREINQNHGVRICHAHLSKRNPAEFALLRRCRLQLQLSFNNEAFPGSATSGTQFALPSFTGTNDPGTAVRWQTIFGTNPTAVNIVLQGAMADVDAEYQTIDTSTATSGEARSIPSAAVPGPVQAKFLRIRFVSSTGGAGLTAKILV
jgi:hypothetical protein